MAAGIQQNITDEELISLKRYKGPPKNYYSVINNLLRFGEESEEYKNSVKIIQNEGSGIIDINKVEKDIENIKKIFDKSSTGYTGQLYRGSYPIINSNDKKTEIRGGILNKGFYSTTPDVNTALSFADDEGSKCCIYKITVDKDVPYIDVNKLIGIPGESEILLPHNILITSLGEPYKENVGDHEMTWIDVKISMLTYEEKQKLKEQEEGVEEEQPQPQPQPQPQRQSKIKELSDEDREKIIESLRRSIQEHTDDLDEPPDDFDDITPYIESEIGDKYDEDSIKQVFDKIMQNGGKRRKRKMKTLKRKRKIVKNRRKTGKKKQKRNRRKTGKKKRAIKRKQ